MGKLEIYQVNHDNKEFWEITELLLKDKVAAQTKKLFEKSKLLFSEPGTYRLDTDI